MDRKYNKNNISFAKVLRKNMTKEERHLWYDFAFLSCKIYEAKGSRKIYSRLLLLRCKTYLNMHCIFIA